MPKSSNCQRVWKAQNTRVTVTQRRMTRPKQEITSRKTSWSQQSRVIRGYEWTRPTFLGLRWKPPLWIYKHLAVILLWQMHSWQADGIHSEGQISPSSSPTDESCYRDIRTCRRRRPAACTWPTEFRLSVSKTVDSSFAQLTQKAQNSPQAFIVHVVILGC